MKESKEVTRWQTARDSDKKHQETLERKYHRLDMLKALIEEHAALAVDDQDRDYLRDMKARRHALEAQILGTKP